MKGRFLLLLTILLLLTAPLPAAGMRGMWIYKTDAIAASPEAADQLFAFCAQRHITDLFWQVHFAKLENGGRAFKNAEPTRIFLQRAHAHSLRVHALFGDPSHALRAKHGIVLASVDGILTFNREGPADAHFDGVHLDIEPHGLSQWKKADLDQKCDLLTQFVEVNHNAVSRAHAAAPGLIYGADIVFWLDKTIAEGKPAYPVTFQGATKDAAKHLLDFVDHVAKTIAYADTAKAKVFVGAKMANIGPKMEGFYGKTETQMMSALKAVDDAYTPHPGYAGLAFFMYEAFKNMPP